MPKAYATLTAVSAPSENRPSNAMPTGNPCSMQEAMRRCSKYGSQADPSAEMLHPTGKRNGMLYAYLAARRTPLLCEVRYLPEELYIYGPDGEGAGTIPC